jgi:hypothetical protein
MNKLNEEMLRLSGLLNEKQEELSIEEFAKKREEGADKIANSAKEKGGVALLTYDHFHVKLPYYKKVSEGKFNRKKFQEEYKELCSELHSHMNDISVIEQSEFQKLVGKIEVIGELLIRNKGNNNEG